MGAEIFHHLGNKRIESSRIRIETARDLEEAKAQARIKE